MGVRGRFMCICGAAGCNFEILRPRLRPAANAAKACVALERPLIIISNNHWFKSP